MNTKICSKCRKDLLLTYFTIHSREKDGHDNVCKVCSAIARQENYKINKEKILKRNRYLLNKVPWRKTLNSIRERCNNPNYPKYPRYGGRGIKCLITEDELKKLWFRDKAYNLNWASIDRENNDGDYTFENCQYIELGANSLKMNLQINTKAVYQLDLSGNIIKEFISISEATRQTRINNISKVLRGICKTAGGYKWKIKE